MRFLALVLALMPVAARATPYLDLTQRFADFATSTAALPDEPRFARFQAEVAPLFPDFYRPKDGESAERYRGRVLKALSDFPALKLRYEKVQANFVAAYATGITHFRAAFPGFKDPAGVVFLHSLGEMDGGTRQLGGKSYLIFGADGIALYHDPDTIGPFFDHELFHVEHARRFTDCDPVWCGLWQEGLATYAAKALSPDADDRMLMLTQPQPIRAAVDARWRDALCLLWAKRNSVSREDYALFFFGNRNSSSFPSRFGYYLGYRLAERAARGQSLRAMAALDNRAAQGLVETTLTAMVKDAGGCPAP